MKVDSREVTENCNHEHRWKDDIHSCECCGKDLCDQCSDIERITILDPNEPEYLECVVDHYGMSLYLEDDRKTYYICDNCYSRLKKLQKNYYREIETICKEFNRSIKNLNKQTIKEIRNK